MVYPKNSMEIKLTCVRDNYIPYKTPKYPNYSLWVNTYEKDLLNIYSIYTSTFTNFYNDHDVDFNFDLFCKFVYNCSSKYI